MKDPNANPVHPEEPSSGGSIHERVEFDPEMTANLRRLDERLRIDPKLFDAVREFQEQMQIITEPFVKAMAEIGERMSVANQKMAEVMKNMPSPEEQAEGFRIATSILAVKGWYISMSHTALSSIQTIARMYQDGKSEEAERSLIHHFNDIADKIIEEACEVAPSRAVLLRKAYVMHQREEYDFSIPVFLTQADGIGFDLLGASPYTKAAPKRKTIETRLSPVLKNDLVSSYWLLVLQTLPINQDTDKLGTYNNPFNRHAVLHGRSADYGSKVNGFRSLSWLQYVVSFSELSWFAAVKEKSGGE